MGLTWAVGLSGFAGGANADRLFRCRRSSVDLPPGPLAAAIEDAPRGTTLVVDVRLVDDRPVTAGLLRAACEQRQLVLVMPPVAREVHAYAACRAVWAGQGTDPVVTAADLRRAGWSLSRIADHLTLLGVPAPGGGRWHREPVRRILRSKESP